MKTIKLLLVGLILMSSVGCVSNVTVTAKKKPGVCNCKCVDCKCGVTGCDGCGCKVGVKK